MSKILLDLSPILSVVLFFIFVSKHYTELKEFVTTIVARNGFRITNDILLCYLFLLSVMLYSVSRVFPTVGVGICGYLLLGMIE